MTTPSQLKSRHLLRALLREASYLPDATARSYFHRYIVKRFRTYNPGKQSFPVVEEYGKQRALKRRPVAVIARRARPLQRKAQKGLNYLRRANQGEINCVEKILHIAYGRMGKRKHALQYPLLRPAADDDTGAPAPLQQLYHSTAPYLAYFDAPTKKSEAATNYIMQISDRFPRLKAIVKSQAANGISMARSVKKPYLETPILNAWHRPMPIKRARNNVRRYFGEMMTQLLPPLPAAEWNSMRDMMEGRKHIGLVRRRTPAVQHDAEPVDEYAVFSDLVDRAISLNKPSQADRPRGARRPHNITVRFMKRIYTRIFPYCCKTEFDSERGSWNVVWGTVRNQISPHIYLAPVAPDLFAGVNDQGGRAKTPRPPRPANVTTEP